MANTQWHHTYSKGNPQLKGVAILPPKISIGGREYRYHVEGRRDPKTKRVKQARTYLGRLNGSSSAGLRPGAPSDVRERIILAALTLLDGRDVSHVTVDVLVRAARISRATFYRHFPGRIEALIAAIDSVYDGVLEVPVLAEEPLGSAAMERERLREWAEKLCTAAVDWPGIHRARLAYEPLRKARARQAGATRDRLRHSIVAYLRRLMKAGMTGNIAPEILAEGILCATEGVVKLVHYDSVEEDPAVLIAGAAEIICRSVFLNGD